MAYPKRRELQRAIQDHLLAHGPRSWEILQAQFADCPVRTFFRYVRLTKAVPAPPEHIAAAIDRVKQVASDSTAVAPVPEQALYSVPLLPISYLTQEGPQALRKLDLIKNIQSSSDDLVALRKYALSPDDGSVVDPKILADTIKLRMTLAELFVKAVNHIWSQERQAQFFQLVMDSVEQESSECAKRIIRRLREVNGVMV